MAVATEEEINKLFNMKRCEWCGQPGKQTLSWVIRGHVVYRKRLCDNCANDSKLVYGNGR